MSAAARFYADALGLSVIGEPSELAAAFRLADGGVLLIFDPERSTEPGRALPSHGAIGAGHAAFSVDAGHLDEVTAELRRQGVGIEQEVSWDEGGRSVYVRDPAGNSVELIEGEAWPDRPEVSG